MLRIQRIFDNKVDQCAVAGTMSFHLTSYLFMPYIYICIYIYIYIYIYVCVYIYIYLYLYIYIDAWPEYICFIIL